MMCSRLLTHKPKAEQGASTALGKRSSDHCDLRANVTMGAQTSDATLLVAVATLAATFFLFVIVPKGFFPVQDTGVILGVSEAAQTVSFPPMADRQQALAQVILQDPAVESLSSFIGVDGTNTTLNSGRIQINLKPLDQRKINASDMIRRLQPELAKSTASPLYMQPVQDLTVEDRVSRTQYQYTLEDADAEELNTWAPKMVANSNPCRNCVTWQATSRITACRRRSLSIATPRRAWASPRR